MSFRQTELGRIEAKKDGGFLTWRQYIAARGFLEEAIRQATDATQRARAAGWATDDPRYLDEVRTIKASYRSWSADNERPEPGFRWSRHYGWSAH